MKVNNRVRWHSAMGVLEGTVKRVDIAKNATGHLIPWFIIGDMIHTLNPKRFSKDCTTRIPSTMLAALKVEVI